MTVTNPQRELHRKPRSLAQALIDRLATTKERLAHSNDREAAHAAAEELELLLDELDRALGCNTRDDASGVLEAEYEG